MHLGRDASRWVWRVAANNRSRTAAWPRVGVHRRVATSRVDAPPSPLLTELNARRLRRGRAARRPSGASRRLDKLRILPERRAPHAARSASRVAESSLAIAVETAAARRRRSEFSSRAVSRAPPGASMSGRRVCGRALNARKSS